MDVTGQRRSGKKDEVTVIATHVKVNLLEDDGNEVFARLEITGGYCIDFFFEVDETKSPREWMIESVYTTFDESLLLSAPMDLDEVPLGKLPFICNVVEKAWSELEKERWRETQWAAYELADELELPYSVVKNRMPVYWNPQEEDGSVIHISTITDGVIWVGRIRRVIPWT